MSSTLQSLLIDANAVIDLNATLPEGDEYTLRANYANQAVRDAAAVGQFSEFDTLIEGVTTSSPFISLPANFRELKVDPQIMEDGGGYRSFPEINAKDRYDNERIGTDYSYILGNPQEGYRLYINQMQSGMTYSVLYQRFPSGMATLTDVCELSDPTYVTRKIESYVLYSRGDDRFPIASSLADKQLSNMYGREMKGPGGQGADTKSKFRNPLS